MSITVTSVWLSASYDEPFEKVALEAFRAVKDQRSASGTISITVGEIGDAIMYAVEGDRFMIQSDEDVRRPFKIITYEQARQIWNEAALKVALGL